jgi:hypothetical protein
VVICGPFGVEAPWAHDPTQPSWLHRLAPLVRRFPFREPAIGCRGLRGAAISVCGNTKIATQKPS